MAVKHRERCCNFWESIKTCKAIQKDYISTNKLAVIISSVHFLILIGRYAKFSSVYSIYVYYLIALASDVIISCHVSNRSRMIQAHHILTSGTHNAWKNVPKAVHFNGQFSILRRAIGR